ncbi:MAG: DUF1499 domain-containing protein [Burkholderiaceae bacterium]
MCRRVSLRPVVVGALAVLLCGCAAQAPAPGANAAPEDTRAALACTLSTQCVNSLGGGGLEPMRYEGTPTQAVALLRATLAEFPEAQIVKTDGLFLQVVFTSPLGFRDLVDFRIDAQAQRIDYRSRSSFGLFDFGKNRSRMSEFSTRFGRIARR